MSPVLEETRRNIHMPKPAILADPTKRRNLGIGLAIIVGLIALGVGLLHTTMFQVERIDITGNKQIKTDDILATTHLRNHMALISVDEKTLDHKLTASPWIASASVTSHWPHVVKVRVVERTAIALVQTTSGKWAQIGEGGIVLTVGPDVVKGLPIPLDLKAPDKPGAYLDASSSDLMQIAKIMPPSLQARTLQMQKQANGDIRLGLDSGTVVELGGMDQIADKLLAAATVISHTDPKNISSLDVRSPHLPLVTTKNGAVATQPTTTAPSTTTKTTVKGTTTTTTIKKPTTTTTVKKATTTTVKAAG